MDLLKNTFKNYFGIELPEYENFPIGFFESTDDYIRYFKKTIYFKQAVIVPLIDNGMQMEDRIIDLASGDGQMSLALYLLGYRNITLFDLDRDRLDFGIKIIKFFLGKDIVVNEMCDSAMNFNHIFDVIISYQTIEHLSNTGNYSIASRDCQRIFLKSINENINKLCYFNAPNYTFPIDGHDTGKLFFHYLPIRVREIIIKKGWVKCSWSGISQPVSLRFLKKHLTRFELTTNYYAFRNMENYLSTQAPFDYMGNRVIDYDIYKLPYKKRFISLLGKILDTNMQNLLPTLSVIYKVK
jgi:SAM-dependent methyltransferase